MAAHIFVATIACVATTMLAAFGGIYLAAGISSLTSPPAQEIRF